MELKRVVVTGIGVVSPVGIGKKPFIEALLAGRSGVRLIERFDTTEYPVKIAAEVKDFDPLTFIDKKWVKRMDLFAQYGAAAATLALEDSGYPVQEDPYAVGALVGSGVGGLYTFYDQIGVLIEKGPTRVSPFFIPMMIPNMAAACSSILLGLKGPVNATCTACAAGTNALGDAFNIIRRGDAVAMFAGGAEAAVNQVGMSAFAALRALSSRNDEPTRASRPFDAGRDGFVMGEGSGILVLEELEHALSRGAHIYAEMTGYGMTADASHLTEPDETGEPAGLAMTRAMYDARIDPSEVDYINAHGTSTPLGDAMETKAIKASLGAHAAKVMISSNKSMFGHCLGAAGALEAAATILCMQEGKVAPTINLEVADPACDLDYVPNVAREADVNVALSNSFGFGGHNAAIVFSRWHG
ncbi:MAG: beta-ketoacyl-[acyl-carrier-protein] synthase II [Actinobacteria bacterium RBG_16_64_13]|nr:MAG: beta-ketoacyl-[acyl-carrier-protein] synthase II [Actinobacteria bacterium RBG_16_64_13]